MKLTLLVGLAFVVITHQKKRDIILPPVYLQTQLNDYNPLMHYGFYENGPTFPRHLAPVAPFIYLQGDNTNVGLRTNHLNFNFEAENADAQPRTKKPSLQRINKPSYPNANLEPRFFLFSVATLTNPFFKKATFTVSTTLIVTKLQSCVVSGDFVNAAAQQTPCRRKRYLMLDTAETPEEESQFHPIVTPTEAILVNPTAPPLSFDVVQDNRLTPVKIQDDSGLSSSKDEVIEREKRFFFNYVVSSVTTTSYSIVTSVVTKTVDLASAAGVSCLPSGYVVC